MATLRIFIADDQIPPTDVTDLDYSEGFLKKYGDNDTNRKYTKQSAFMRQVVNRIRESGYIVTTARTFKDAKKQISDYEFDVAIVDLGWPLEEEFAKDERMTAGWRLCDMLDEAAEKYRRPVSQIVFSSRFLEQPDLSRDAAMRQSLPIFKSDSEVCSNSLMAAIRFVEATLAAQKAQADDIKYKSELRGIVVDSLKEAISDYRRWGKLALVFVAVSLASVLAGALLAFFGEIAVATLISIASMLSSAISGLLFIRLDSAQKSLESARRDTIKELSSKGG